MYPLYESVFGNEKMHKTAIKNASSPTPLFLFRYLLVLKK
jgi:hypothetical protein